jgi:hypothetical protein
MEAPAPAQAFPLRGPLAEGGSSTFKYLPLFQPHAAAMARPASCATPANKGAPRPDTPSQPEAVALCARS